MSTNEDRDLTEWRADCAAMEADDACDVAVVEHASVSDMALYHAMPLDRLEDWIAWALRGEA